MESAGARSAPEASTSQQLTPPAGKRKPQLYRLAPLLLVLTCLLAWEWGARSGRVSALFFPAPTTIAVTLGRLLIEDGLLMDTAITLFRMSVGLLIGGIAGIVMGMLMGWSSKVRSLAEPFVAGIHPIPKSALLPLFLVLMGIGDRPRLALVALAAFFPLLINTMNSVRNIEPTFLEVAANYGARGLKLFQRVILPATLPGILSGARIAANTAMTIAITTELLTSRNGLGARIWMAWETMRTENLYATLIIIVIVGLAINLILSISARKLMPWSPEYASIEK